MKDIRRTLKVPLYLIICSTADTSGVSGMVYEVNKIMWKKKTELTYKASQGQMKTRFLCNTQCCFGVGSRLQDYLFFVGQFETLPTLNITRRTLASRTNTLQTLGLKAN